MYGIKYTPNLLMNCHFPKTKQQIGGYNRYNPIFRQTTPILPLKTQGTAGNPQSSASFRAGKGL